MTVARYGVSMIDDVELRVYLRRRLVEVRRIRAEAEDVEREVSDVLSGSGTLDPVRLDKWIDKRRTELAHVDVELMVLAAASIGTPSWQRWAVYFAREALPRWERRARRVIRWLLDH